MGRKTSKNMKVEFAIDISEVRKYALYTRSMIYTLPTLMDHFGITLIEAGIRGNFIVTSDAIGPAYVMDSKSKLKQQWGYVTKYGYVARKSPLKHRYIHNLVDAYDYAITNWERSIKRTLDFRKKIIEQFTWRNITKQYLALYRTIK